MFVEAAHVLPGERNVHPPRATLEVYMRVKFHPLQDPLLEVFVDNGVGQPVKWPSEKGHWIHAVPSVRQAQTTPRSILCDFFGRLYRLEVEVCADTSGIAGFCDFLSPFDLLTGLKSQPAEMRIEGVRVLACMKVLAVIDTMTWP